MEPLPPGQLVFLTFYFAVILSAVYAGTWSGLLSTFIGIVLGYVFFSGSEPTVITHLEAVGLFITGAFISALGGARLKARVDRRERAAQQQSLADRARENDGVRNILVGMSDGVIATDTDGRVTLLNPGAAALVDSSEQSALGRDVDEVFRTLNLHTLNPVFNPAKRALREGKPARLPVHSVLVAHNGSRHPIDASAAPIKDASGGVTGSVLVFRDITERQEQEQQMMVKGKQKEDFLATLAHEFRNPLAPLCTALHLLELAPDLNTLKEVRPVMVRQVDRLVRLVDDLIDLNRMERGIVDLHMEKVDMRRLLEQVVDTSHPLAMNAHLTVELDLPAEPLYTTGDRERLKRIFTNLVTYACENARDHGTILIGLARKGTDVLVRVEHEGSGVQDDGSTNLFARSTGASGPDNGKGGMIGLGLAVVKHLVDAHGGHVSVKNVIGQGTEFSVRLASSVDDTLSGTAPLTTMHQEYRRRRVIIVDDNEDTADLLGVSLTRSGHEVHVVHDGVSALHEGATVHPEVVIMDIGMPRMDGYATARLIRNEAWGRHVTLIALTGWGRESDLALAREAGFDHHLVKPLSHETLDQILAMPMRLRAVS